MKTKWIYILVLLPLLGSLFGVIPVKADAPPDELASYIITIAPQSDGTLVMSYQLQHYCAKSDWPAEYPYLQVGVPNSTFTITDWNPKESFVTEAKPVNSGGSFVRFDFNPLPKNGDCFDLSFTITQGKMAFPTTDDTNEVTFKFIPSGWTFPIKIASLTVMWTKSPDASLLKLTDPNPKATNDNIMIWQWTNPVMSSSGMFSDYAVKIAYDKSAFSLSEVATSPSDNANGGDGGLSLFWIIVIVVIVVIVIILVLDWLTDGELIGIGGGGGYYSGGGLGGGHSGGGGLGGGGRGSSCACASCACACACAGGGRVGCSRKGIGIQCIRRVIKKVTGENQ